MKNSYTFLLIVQKIKINYYKTYILTTNSSSVLVTQININAIFPIFGFKFEWSIFMKVYYTYEFHNLGEFNFYFFSFFRN